MRASGLDVHRDFCEVAIAEGGEVRSAGRIDDDARGARAVRAEPRPRRPGGAGGDGNAWEIARIIEPHVAPGDRCQPQRHWDPPGAREDRPPRRAHAGEAAGRGLAGGGVDARRARPGRCAGACSVAAAGQGAHAGQERGARGADAPAGPKAAGQRPVRHRRADAGLRARAADEERETVDGVLRQIDFLDAEVAEVERVIANDALDVGRGSPADDRPGRQR